MSYWASLSPSVRGFVRGLALVVVFGVLDYVSKNLGTSGLVTPAIAGIVTGIIASIENSLTNVAKAQLQ